MKINDLINEDGRIVNNVNTTADVSTTEIKTQAAKFGNTVDKDGRPPSMSKKVKGSSTNVAFNVGMTESRAYDDGVADGSRGKKNPRASSIYGPNTNEYEAGFAKGTTQPGQSATKTKPTTTAPANAEQLLQDLTRKITAQKDVDTKTKVQMRRDGKYGLDDWRSTEMNALLKQYRSLVDAMNNESVTENASAGATSAGAVAAVANPQRNERAKKNKTKESQKKNKDGTVKNAIDSNSNLMSGTVNKATASKYKK